MESIGRATLEPDGTLILTLRAEGEGGVGDAMLRYPPDHPSHGELMDHLGGLTPGESKPVLPWKTCKGGGNAGRDHAS